MKLEEREIDNCLIMRIKKLKEQVKNLIQQMIGSCILAFTKNKKEKQDEQTTFNSTAYHEKMKRIDAEIKLEQAKEIIKIFLKYSEYDEFEQKEFDEYFDNKNKAEQFLKEIEK